MSVDRKFKTVEWVTAKDNIVDSKGAVVLPSGQEAQIVVYDPVKHEDSPYGIRIDPSSSAVFFVKEDQLLKHPTRKAPSDIWTANPAEYYRHPDNPRHEELRGQGWKIDPKTVGLG